MQYCFWLQVFQGNSDPDTVVTNMLKMAVNARYVRIKPQSWHNHIAIRAEVYKGAASKLITYKFTSIWQIN